ncbi:MAG: DnaA N-terminal domain-containing protein, partial [Gammaproteobacteria bacterium]
MPGSLWDKCVQQLQHDLPEQHFNTWIRPLQAVHDEDTLRLLAPNRFVVDWVRQHFLSRIVEITADCAGKDPVQ